MDRNGATAITRLNRPERLNAFTTQMRDDLVAAFDNTDADDAVRVVVLTETGRVTVHEFARAMRALMASGLGSAPPL